jgi:hypothetical protein
MTATYWPVDSAGRLASGVVSPVVVPVPTGVTLPSISFAVINAKNWAWRATQQQTPGCVLDSWPTFADACLGYGAALIDGPTSSLVGVILGSQAAFPASCGNACLSNNFALRGAVAMAGIVSTALATGGVPYTTASTWSAVRSIASAMYTTYSLTSPGAQPYLQLSIGGIRDDSYIFVDCSYQAFYAACVAAGPLVHYTFGVRNAGMYGDTYRHFYAFNASGQLTAGTQADTVLVSTVTYSGKGRPSFLPNGGWVTAAAFSLTGAPVTTYSKPVYFDGNLACVVVGSYVTTAGNVCGDQCRAGAQWYAATAVAASSIATVTASVAGLSSLTAVRALTSAVMRTYSGAYVPVGVWVGGSGVDVAIAFSCGGPPGAFVHPWGSVCTSADKGIAGVQTGVPGTTLVRTTFYEINLVDGTPMTDAPLLTTAVALLSGDQIMWLGAHPFYVGAFTLNISVASNAVFVRFDRTLPMYSASGAYAGCVLVSSMPGATCASGCMSMGALVADSFAALALAYPSVGAQATITDVQYTSEFASQYAVLTGSPLVAFATSAGAITCALNCSVMGGGCPAPAVPGVGAFSNAAVLNGPPRTVIGYGPIGTAAIPVGAGVATGIVVDATMLAEYTIGTGTTLDAAGTPNAVWSTLTGSPSAAYTVHSTAVFTQDGRATAIGVASAVDPPHATCSGKGALLQLLQP